MNKHLISLAATLVLTTPVFAQNQTAPSPGEIVDRASQNEWVKIAAEDLVIMTLAPDSHGQPREVMIQLIPEPFSQGWVKNIRTLARAGWYDDITINRVQDNYVVQWGDPNYDNPEAEGEAKPLPEGLRTIDEEDYTSPVTSIRIGEMPPEGYGWTRGDAYAAWTDLYKGWPIASDGKQDWPVHCYGMVGVGRGMSPDTGTGAELYTVIGHAPRHLDRNIALVGRIVEGMEHLSSLPRGSGALGFYTAEESSKRTPIVSVRIASDLPADERPSFEYLSTEGETFAEYADARANRRDPFFITAAGGADICNIPVPVRRTDR
ncbi:peptidylprolyl isomerase [Qipengyuania sp. GH1]|uniref:peptidylprolyl isomerase n=1 Tax=Qipengyuania aestuarii TaxID=2867241 RepID=UPI001C8763FF|nr:peptidylprolyl isomerase [Qipengyuania aestuarii]MBX7535963.1 peptidylprolyl isomerase [Qipengyuania aestuarii]